MKQLEIQKQFYEMYLMHQWLNLMNSLHTFPPCQLLQVCGIIDDTLHSNRWVIIITPCGFIDKVIRSSTVTKRGFQIRSRVVTT